MPIAKLVKIGLSLFLALITTWFISALYFFVASVIVPRTNTALILIALALGLGLMALIGYRTYCFAYSNFERGLQRLASEEEELRDFLRGQVLSNTTMASKPNNSTTKPTSD